MKESILVSCCSGKKLFFVGLSLATMAAAQALAVQVPGFLKFGDTYDVDNVKYKDKYCKEDGNASTCCEKGYKERFPADATLDTGCAWISVTTGPAAPGASLPPGFFSLTVLEPSPAIYTPSRLRYVLGYSLQRLSLADTPAGLPRRVEAIGTQSESIVFQFADNEAVGVPLSGDFSQRLFMVDAEGWATATDPAYYDLHPGDGSFYRFSAARHLPGYLSLVLYRDARGREETLQTLDMALVFDEAFRNLRQVLAPSCLADITPLPETAEGYTITFYHRDDVSAQPNSLGLYLPEAGATPFAVWTFDNPDFQPPDPDAPNPAPVIQTRLRVTKTVGVRSEVSVFEYTADSDAWTLATGGGTVNKAVANSWSDDLKSFIEEKHTLAPDGTRLNARANRYELLGDVYRIVTDTKDPEGDAFSINYSYYADKVADGINFGRIRSVTESDGSWRTHDYDAAGNETQETAGWLDAPFGAVNQAVTTAYSYDAILPSDILNSSLTKNDRRPRAVTRTVCGVPVSRTHYAYTRNAAGETVDMESRAASADAAPFAAGSLTTTRTYYAPGSGVSSGLLKSVEHPDGQVETHTYERGSYTAHADPSQCAFTPAPAGKAWRHTITRGTVQNPGGILGRTLRTAEVLDRNSNPVLSETQVCAAAGVFETLSRTANTYDRLNRHIRTASTDGTSEEYTWGDNCCGMASKRAADGTETAYEYDAAKRLVAETKTDINGIPALRTAYTLNAAGRRVKTTLSNISGNVSLFPALPSDVTALLPADFQLHTAIVLSQLVYSDGGTLLSSTDAQGRVTTYQSGNFGKVSTVISPSGLTTVTVRHADGQIAYREENGVRTATHAYGVDAGGQHWNLSVQGAYDPNQPYAALDVPWSKGTTDFLGRSLTTERPGFGGAVLVSSNSYDTASRLTATTLTTDHCPLTTALYTYDDFSVRLLSAQDLNGNGVIDLAGLDRVQGSFSRYAKQGNDWVQITGSVSYPLEGSALPVTNMLVYTWLTGLEKLSPTDIFATHGITLPPSAVLAAKGETHSLADSGDYILAASQYNVLDSVSRRRWQIAVSPASGASVTETLNGLTVSTSRYPVLASNVVPSLPTPNSELQISHFSYDPLGRQTCVFSPSSANRLTATFTQRNAKGQTAWQEDAYGTRTSYTYDANGHRVSTTQSSASIPNSSFLITHYSYDPKGRMVATWGATYPVSYDYDVFGRKIAMYTYRGSTEITSAAQMLSLKPQMDRTSWLYDNPTGLLTNKLYADNLGPSYTYTPDGKLATRIWARLTTENQPLVTCYSYDNAGSLTNTAYSDNTPTISFTYDRLGRQISATDAAGLTAFAYDLQGNLTNETTVAHGVPPCTLTQIYDSYGRPTGYALDGAHTTTLGYDPFGRIADFSVIPHFSFLTTNSFTWSYLPSSSLKQTVDYPNGIQVSYAYEQHRDLLVTVQNQLTTDHWPLTTISRYDYTNDAVGRRTQMNYLGETFTAPDQIAYGYNARSEVTNATAQTDTAYNYAYAYDPIGNRTSSSSVLASGAKQSSEYLANELNQYTNIVSNPGYMRPKGENPLNPLNPVENFTPVFDADGNQTLIKTTTGIWHITYNGENRPVAWSNDASGIVITMAYDRMGRRIAYNSPTESKRMTYNGYTLIRETTVSPIPNSASLMTNSVSYVWDPTESVATKPLVSLTTDHQTLITNCCYYVHDGNKNVSALLDSSGVISDGYIYSPFGLVTSFILPTPATPFRFSSEYHDDALGLVSYNWRHYNSLNGRWTRRDSIGEVGGKNLYSFVKNRPVNRLDILGRSCKDIEKEDPSNWTEAERKKLELMKEKDCPIPKVKCDCKCESGKGGYYESSSQTLFLCQRTKWFKDQRTDDDYKQTRKHELSHAFDHCMGAAFVCEPLEDDTILCSELRAYHWANEITEKQDLINNACSSWYSVCVKKKNFSEAFKTDLWDACKEKASKIYDQCVNLNDDVPLPRFPVPGRK